MRWEPGALCRVSFEIEANLSKGKNISDAAAVSSAADSLLETVPPSIVENRFEGISFFDCTDLVFYLAHHKMPSGIQRVTLQLFKEIFDRLDLWSRIEFIAFDKRRQRYVRIDRSDWLMLINHVIVCGVDDLVQSKFQAANNSDWSVFKGRPVHDDQWRGSRIFVIGAGWVTDCVPALAEAREMGAFVNLLVYDLIPLRRPEFFTMGTRAQFESWLKPMLAIADKVFAISKHASNDVESYVREIGFPPIVVEAIKLGTFDLDATVGADEEGTDFIVGDYAIFVSTIEARKNHILLFRVWSDLLREGVDLPKLVFVGRMGWNIEELQRNLDQSNQLDGAIEILNDLTDFELSKIYRGAKFAVYPSWCEGWGLPVTEAIAAGCPVIASDATAIPEAGGAAAKYISPDDYEGWKGAVRQWAESKDPREFVDLDAFELPRWSDSLNQLLAVTELNASEGRSPRRPSIELGREYVFSHAPHSRAQSRAIAAETLTHTTNVIPMWAFDAQPGRVGRGWGEREQWGSWTLANRKSDLVLSVAGSEKEFFLILNCQVPAAAVGLKLVVALNDASHEVFPVSESFSLCLRVTGDEPASAADLRLSIMLACGQNQVRHLKSLHGRPLGVGVRSLLALKSTDLPRWAQISTQLSAKGSVLILADY